MTNGDAFNLANATEDNDLKRRLRERFNDWCEKSDRAKMSPMAIRDWFKEECDDLRNPHA